MGKTLNPHHTEKKGRDCWWARNSICQMTLCKITLTLKACKKKIPEKDRCKIAFVTTINVKNPYKATADWMQIQPDEVYYRRASLQRHWEVSVQLFIFSRFFNKTMSVDTENTFEKVTNIHF